jgi:hypothetical protein
MSEDVVPVLRRLAKIAPSMLACVAILMWGFASVAHMGHHANLEPVFQAEMNNSQNHGHAAAAADDEGHGGVASAPAGDDRAAGDHDCSMPGCAFAAVPPPTFAVVGFAAVSERLFAPGSGAPKKGSAPPLRPPRLS